MIITVIDMYKSFLAGIKKEHTSIVPPSQFNLLINEEQNNWFKEKVMALEVNQKRIDDLRILRTSTDGVYEYNAMVLNPIGLSSNSKYNFPLPVDPTINYPNVVGLTTSGTQKYPKYRRLMNIMFKIKYKNNECGKKGISDWLDARIMRSDSRTEVLKNPYRKPSDSRLYYEILGNEVRLITGTDSEGYAMRIEYLRYPREIYFNSSNPNDNNNINCELDPEQQQEIVDMAVLTYIERTKNPRYKTVSYEQAKKNQIN